MSDLEVRGLTWVAAALVGSLEARSARRVDRAADPVAATSLIDVLVADYRLDDAGDINDPTLDRMEVLAGVYGLDDLDTALLAATSAPHLDATIAAAFDLLTGGTDGWPTVAVLLELVGIGTADAAAGVRLGPGSILQRYGLIEVAVSERPLLRRIVRGPDRIAAHLRGDNRLSPLTALMLLAAHPVPSPEAELAARSLAAGSGLVWVRAPLGHAGTSVAVTALAHLNLAPLCIDLTRRPPGTSAIDATVAAVLDASLIGRGLIVAGADELAGNRDIGRPEALMSAPGPVLAIGTAPWRRDWMLGEQPWPFTVDAPALTPSQRARIWQAELPELHDPSSLDGVQAELSTLRLAPEDVALTAAQARLMAAAGDVPVTTEVVREAARALGAANNAGRGAVTRRSAVASTFADLSLNPGTAAELHRLVGWARHRDEVTSQGDVHGKAGKGIGIAALFTGSPGTGKTLAAHVVADELGLELFQVDLSGVVDKYIGETEKNLEKIFHDAETRNVVLFFDEADALFGSRSSVKDSRDRYANQEVSYLLQRMEHYDGITILATNLRGNLDAAFSRRMQFLIHFPDPDEATRARLWEQHLRQAGALDTDNPVDIANLAKWADLAGGDIRNIVLGAAYDAISVGEPVGMRHVRAATAREFQKLSRRLPPAFAADGPPVVPASAPAAP
ncbi:MAG: ATP-binding protein [Jatrophihabitantaceae bacterium]|nr:ATP-binding protein [Jatrophihabitantaceae bacterium]